MADSINSSSNIADSDVSKKYPLPDIEYAHFNKSLIEGVHTDLPNPYYKQQLQEENERTDYAHPTENIIHSIIREYGPFNEITEEKLLKLIQKDESAMDLSLDSKTTTDVGKDDTISIKKDEIEFYTQRDEILNYIREALGSSIMSLDFVSLLLSSVRPAAGSSSMSPHLKQNIKIGSLSCDRIVPDISDPEEDQRQKNIDSMTVGRGLKLQSLQKSSNLLKDAVSRLQKNLSDENTYWNEVMNVLKEKELITTVSAPIAGAPQVSSKQANTLRQRKLLAVKYGYGDSGSDYFDNGIAVLKKGIDGHLLFEKLNQNEREKTWGGQKIVSVKIYKNSPHLNGSAEIVGQSDSYRTLKKEIIENDDSFVAKVKNSRFFIFENELFWHLMKEAASLITVQVTVIDSYIKVDLLDYSIYLEALDIHSDDARTPTPVLPQNHLADNIIKFFRILLCGNNYKNTQKLRIPPVALSKEPNTQKNRHGVLIRPIIMYTRHNRAISQFKEMLRSLLLDLGLSEEDSLKVIKEDLIVKKYINDPNSLQQFNTKKRCYNNDPFLRVYSKMAPSSLLILKHGNLKTWIELNSSYTTLHISINVKVTKLNTGEIVLESIFDSSEDVEQCLSWILKQYE
ncbi:RNA polymerase II mediator complex subunit [Pichia californica]|nr:RNA polymerase II mediator complex subunit [[Candida] californica]